MSGENRKAPTPTPPPPPLPSFPDTASRSQTAKLTKNHGDKQSCETHTHKPHTGNRPRQPGKKRPGKEAQGGPLSFKDNNTPRTEVAGGWGSCPENKPEFPHFLKNTIPSCGCEWPGRRTPRLAQGGGPLREAPPAGQAPKESPQPARPRLGERMGDRSRQRPSLARPLARPSARSLTAGVSGSQPRAGAAVRRRRRRRDPGPRRRVIIPPARASPGPGPGPRPPEPPPRPSRGGSLLSLPPTPAPSRRRRRRLGPARSRLGLLLSSGATAGPLAPQPPLSPDPTS
ncbi:proline-rich protein HaeIII subfamily 1-like [Elephas maximus indicus]|uniref:proline-rich protein HaeIII subfamily 1-like n=1 Tax=Elephas maximus indicus TaxID=99487 RepID=UPI0021166CF7|nr:proline-rich protein HaeIII subfamily 1-like [Elephas maximus indicus]